MLPNLTRPKWQIALPVALLIILLIPVLTWPQFNACNNEGPLRLSIVVDGDSMSRVSGQLMGEGASRYRAEGAKVALYAKTDLWYNSTQESIEGVKMEQSLGVDCSWQIDQVHEGQMYAAFLVSDDYRQPNTIPKTSNIDLPPLAIDGTHVLAWALWSAANPTGNPDPALLWPKNRRLAIAWLIRQITPNETVPQPLTDRAGLIIGYALPQTDEAYPYLFARSWIFDDALAGIAFTANANFGEAQAILNALKGQVQADGKLGFSYNTDNDWFHEYYRSGAIAWVGYALVFYQQKTGDAQSQAVAEQIAAYLLSLQNQTPDSPSYGAIQDDPAVSSFTTSQNIITYFFLRDLARLTSNDLYQTAADLIKTALLEQYWDEKQGHFVVGSDDTAAGLIESNSLGALFLEATGHPTKAQLSLDFVEQTYQPVLGPGPIDGYAPYADRSTVWSQGSLQVALAHRRLGNITKSQAILGEIIKLQDEEGGVAYARPKATITGTDEVFQEWASVAGTTWLAIVLADDEQFLGP
ncbi:MAG: hypothetical protein H6631_13020 [Anaerolineaceae bacterium]|nr:hypothetical protein [Anaerolineae bacterium]MCB9078514.1 hypothetical protein [Anaerolineaceae bacterium]MCB9099176.1 hypothetical protein [Anaerolineales bacterium]